MTLGPLMVDIGGAELSGADRELLAHPLIGSVLLFARNYVDPAQLQALTAQIRSVRNPSLWRACITLNAECTAPNKTRSPRRPDRLS